MSQYATMKWLLSTVDFAIHLVKSIPVRSQRSSQDRLEEFRRSIMRLRNINDGIAEVLSFSTELFGTEHVGILVWDEDLGQFVNRSQVEGLRSSWNVYDPFFVTVTEYDRVLSLKEMSLVKDLNDRQTLLSFFRDTHASFVLPLILNETVIAVIFVGNCIAPDVSLIEDFRTYAVLALSNSIIYTRVESLLVSLEDKVKERTKQLEEATNQMIQSEKMATLGVMVAGVAHELNTPSGIIINASENLFQTTESFLDQLSIHEWLTDTIQISQFVKIVKFFTFHVLKGPPIRPASGFALRRRLRQSFEELNVLHEDTDELAAFFIDHGFIPKIEDAGKDEVERRLATENVFSLIVGLYSEIDANDRKEMLSYLHNVGSIYRNVKNITSSATGIAKLVKALRIYSRSSAGDFVKSNIEELLDTTLEILGSIWKGNMGLWRNYGNIGMIECDPDRLNQIWSNLLMNAYHATRDRPEPTIQLKTEDLNDRVRITIRDNGSGIPEQVQEKIWDPFFTTKDQGEGTGLGLSIVRRIIEEHNGTIHFETAANQGTAFIIELPKCHENRAAKPSRKPGLGRYDWR